MFPDDEEEIAKIAPVPRLQKAAHDAYCTLSAVHNMFAGAGGGGMLLTLASQPIDERVVR